MTQTAPALFFGHGSPINAIEDTPSSRGWRAVARGFRRPRAVICVSAHWVTEGVRVTAAPKPRTIHDFGGFPPELFAVQYPAPGDPALAEQIVGLLARFDAQADHRWGLDHGTWSVLVHAYPEVDVPVVQVSLDATRGPREHIAIGQALAPLRQEGVLVMGSGNIVHNLRAFFGRGATSAELDRTFDDHIVAAIARGDDETVLSYKTHAAAAHAAPDWDHFFPLFTVLGARGAGEPAHVFNREFFPGVSMTSIGFGLA